MLIVILTRYTAMISAMSCAIVILDDRAGRDRATSEDVAIQTLGAHCLDNQSSLSPHFELDSRTTRNQITERERNLGCLVDKRLTVMHHTQSVDVAHEAVSTRSGLGDVAISNDFQRTRSRIDFACEVVARNHAIAVILIDNLGALETESEVRTHKFLNSLRVSHQMSRLGTTFSKIAIKRCARKRTGSILTRNI